MNATITVDLRDVTVEEIMRLVMEIQRQTSLDTVVEVHDSDSGRGLPTKE